MKKLYCEYCGKPLVEECDCKYKALREEQDTIERLEYEQEQNGFYAFQDKMEMWRNER